MKALDRHEKLRSKEIEIYVEFADTIVKSYDATVLQKKSEDLKHKDPDGAKKIADFLRHLNQVKEVNFFLLF